MDALLRELSAIRSSFGVGLLCIALRRLPRISSPEWKGCGALVAAWAFPLVSESVVAYYSWRASGSIVNKYSVWILIWLVVGLGIWWLTIIRSQLEARGRSMTHSRQ